MFLSDKQKEERYRLVRQEMREQNVDVLLVRGSSATRGEGANFRFLADFPNINIPLVLFFFRDESRPSIMLVESPFQTEKAKKGERKGQVYFFGIYVYSRTAKQKKRNHLRGYVTSTSKTMKKKWALENY